MTVKELINVLNAVENKEMEVKHASTFYGEDVNGYYFNKSDDEKTLVLTTMYVQPI